ncbi:MAG: response regulator [Candidatus Woesearchaeota archaeon]
MAEKKMYVVAADDDPMVRRLLEYCCNQAGYSNGVSVVMGSFCNGQKAWNYIKLLATQPHLLITDLNMPEMRGDDLIRLSRKQFPDLPVIMISAVEPGLTESAKDLADLLKVEFVEKPLKAFSFIEAVAKYAPKE